MSPSDTAEDATPDDAAPEASALETFAADVAAAVGGTAAVAFDTAKVGVDATRWVDSLRTARDEFGLVYFSWLSAIHWTNQVAVGEKLSEDVAERLEVLCTIGDLSEGRLVTLSTDIAVENPRIESLVSVFAGADWHEREAHDMFGIVFDGHPGLEPLYLPNGFSGHPLLKSYPLLSREVKPWPGKVDVEAMPDAGDDDDPVDPDAPSTENPEA